MTNKLLRQITFMCLCLMLGAINWITAPLTSKLWISILCEAASIYSFFMAYVCYRRARKTAEAIDAQTTLTLTIIHYGEKSESKGQEQAEEPVQP